MTQLQGNIITQLQGNIITQLQGNVITQLPGNIITQLQGTSSQDQSSTHEGTKRHVSGTSRFSILFTKTTQTECVDYIFWQLFL